MPLSVVLPEDLAAIRATVNALDDEDFDLLLDAHVRRTSNGTVPPSDWLPMLLRAARLPSTTESSAPRHSTGSARTEGYYRRGAEERRRQELVTGRNELVQRHALCKQVSRSTRAQQRALTHSIAAEAPELLNVDALKFSQLRARAKNLQFGRSRIHGWGLFTMEVCPTRSAGKGEW